MRTAEVYRDDCWVPTDFYKVKKGATFKLFEPDGTLVSDKDGNEVLVAVSDPYLNAEGVLTIDTRPYIRPREA